MCHFKHLELKLEVIPLDIFLSFFTPWQRAVGGGRQLMSRFASVQGEKNGIFFHPLFLHTGVDYYWTCESVKLRLLDKTLAMSPRDHL